MGSKLYRALRRGNALLELMLGPLMLFFFMSLPSVRTTTSAASLLDQTPLAARETLSHWLAERGSTTKNPRNAGEQSVREEEKRNRQH